MERGIPSRLATDFRDPTRLTAIESQGKPLHLFRGLFAGARAREAKQGGIVRDDWMRRLDAQLIHADTTHKSFGRWAIGIGLAHEGPTAHQVRKLLLRLNGTANTDHAPDGTQHHPRFRFFLFSDPRLFRAGRIGFGVGRK